MKSPADCPASMSPQGACITLGASNPLLWRKLFDARYKVSRQDNANEDHDVQKPDCHWVDNVNGDESTITDTLIKYSDDSIDFAII